MLIPVMEQFDARLLELPRLLRGLEHRTTAGFPADAVQWLTGVCELAEQNHLQMASDLALVRADLLLFTPRAATEPGVTGSKRQQTEQFAVQCLTRAHDLILACFASLRQAYQECEPACRQALAVAAVQGKLTAQDTAEQATACLRSDASLLPVWTQIIGRLGAANAHVLLDRMIAQIER
nr:hypothetical protein [uncultured Agathobaculum sp.]